MAVPYPFNGHARACEICLCFIKTIVLAEYVALEDFMHNCLGVVSFSQACLGASDVVMETVT